MQQFYDLPDFPRLEAKNIPGLPPIPINNRLWKEWEPEIQAHRVRVHRETEEKWSGQQKAREEQVRLVKADGRYWMNVFGSIYEAKSEATFMEEDDWVDINDQGTTGWVVPFVLYPFQMYVWDHQMRAMRTRGVKGDTLYIKSRQMGLTNLLSGVNSHSWMARRPFQGRLLSRKEDLVDETNNPDSIFWKIKLQLSGQPGWLLQSFAPGFDWRRDYMQASLTNPVNFNHLAGESTNATAGRGGTATLITLDEFAFMRGGSGIWTATRAATYHRAAVTTVELKFGMHAYELAETVSEEEGPATLYIPWWVHPYHDEAWLEQERKRDTDAGFRKEVLMDWHGDESMFVYPELSAKTIGDYPYIPFGGPTFVAFDDGYRNNWAFWIIQYVQKEGRHRILDYYENKQLPVDFYGSLWRGIKLDGFRYERDEDQIIDFLRYIQQPVYVGDTHGNHVEQTSGQSVIERLATRWSIYVNVAYEKRSYKDRQDMTSRQVPFMDFNDTPRMKHGLTRFQTFHWKEDPETMERTTWIKEPVKDASADTATAMEYYCVNFEAFLPVYAGGGLTYE
jgi:hypothetical protein